MRAIRSAPAARAAAFGRESIRANARPNRSLRPEGALLSSPRGSVFGPPFSFPPGKENGPPGGPREKRQGDLRPSATEEGWMCPLDPALLGGGAPRKPGQPLSIPLWVRCQGVRGRPRPSFQSSPAAVGEQREAGRSPGQFRQRESPPPVPRPKEGGGRLFGGGRDRARALPWREAVEGPGHVGLPRRLLATFGRSKAAPPSPPAAGIPALCAD